MQWYWVALLVSGAFLVGIPVGVYLLYVIGVIGPGSWR